MSTCKVFTWPDPTGRQYKLVLQPDTGATLGYLLLYVAVGEPDGMGGQLWTKLPRAQTAMLYHLACAIVTGNHKVEDRERVR
jgi:hypothetical protein